MIEHNDLILTKADIAFKINRTLDVFKIWDYEKSKWWITPKGKTEWKASNHAANAVNANPPEHMIIGWYTQPNKYPKYCKFKDQKRLGIVRIKYKLDDVEFV